MKAGLQRDEERAWGSRKGRQRDALADAGVEVKYELVHGIRIRYVVSAGSGDPLLFCNGIGANLELAVPFIKAMKGTRVVAFDVPGVGGSEAGFFWPSFSGFAKFAVGLLNALGFTGHFDVAGVSWGGGLAQTIARTYPDRVGRMVLMATAAGWPMIPGRASALMRMMTPQRYISRSFMARNAAVLYGGEVRGRPDLAIEYANQTKAPRTTTYLAQLAAIAQFSSYLWLHRIHCPTLVMTGEDDPIIRPINARIMAALLPNGTLHVVRGGGHLFMLLRAEEISKVIKAFLESAPKILSLEGDHLR